jgi:hypothetical protein
VFQVSHTHEADVRRICLHLVPTNAAGRCERQQAQKNNKPNFASSTCMLSIEKLEMGRG